ncbi:hypothetical protein Ocin01_18673, partial [Orchesella cincta]
MALSRFTLLRFSCVVFCFILICDGATVQFFAEPDFKGEVIQVTSSANCTQTPYRITEKVFWSAKSTSCIVMFFRNDCTSRNFLQSYAIDNIVRNEIKQQLGVRQSFRDCTDLERGPQVHLDYDWVPFRDICGCTNLPVSNSKYKRIYTYGNLFTFYKNFDCQGEATAVPTSLRYIHQRVSSMRSVIPREIPSHCSSKCVSNNYC